MRVRLECIKLLGFRGLLTDRGNKRFDSPPSSVCRQLELFREEQKVGEGQEYASDSDTDGGLPPLGPGIPWDAGESPLDNNNNGLDVNGEVQAGLIMIDQPPLGSTRYRQHFFFFFEKYCFQNGDQDFRIQDTRALILRNLRTQCSHIFFFFSPNTKKYTFFLFFYFKL